MLSDRDGTGSRVTPDPKRRLAAFPDRRVQQVTESFTRGEFCRDEVSMDTEQVFRPFCLKDLGLPASGLPVRRRHRNPRYWEREALLCVIDRFAPLYPQRGVVLRSEPVFQVLPRYERAGYTWQCAPHGTARRS